MRPFRPFAAFPLLRGPGRRRPLLPTWSLLVPADLLGELEGEGVLLPDVVLRLGRNGSLTVLDRRGRLAHRFGPDALRSCVAGSRQEVPGSRRSHRLTLDLGGRRLAVLMDPTDARAFVDRLTRQVAPRAQATVSGPPESRRARPSSTLLPPAPRLLSGLLALLVALAASLGALGLARLAPGRPHLPPLPPGEQLSRAVAAGSAAALRLAPARTRPVPLAAALEHQPPLRPHETLGFLPYWTLPDLPPADLAGLTTVAYFSVSVQGNGEPVTTGPGWTAYRSQALASVVSAVHRAGGRVVLTLSCFSPSALDQLSTDPAAQANLASTAVHLVAAAGLDGVNLDLEGTGASDRAGFVRLVGTVARALHQANPGWQLTLDTYGSSAADPAGFFDVPALAPDVDAFVVMAYDMQDPRYPGPTAPLSGPGTTDQLVLAQYRAVVPADQVILGLPLYAVAWPTTGPAAGAAATGPPTYLADLAVPRDQVYWDPTTQTPWAVVGSGSAVEQVWFDDQASLAAKAQAAAAAGVRGVALWALGMASPAAEQAALQARSLAPPPPVGPQLAVPEPPLVPIPTRPVAASGPPAVGAGRPGVPGSGGLASDGSASSALASSGSVSSSAAAGGTSSAPPSGTGPPHDSGAGASPLGTSDATSSTRSDSSASGSSSSSSAGAGTSGAGSGAGPMPSAGESVGLLPATGRGAGPGVLSAGAASSDGPVGGLG